MTQILTLLLALTIAVGLTFKTGDMTITEILPEPTEVITDDYIIPDDDRTCQTGQI